MKSSWKLLLALNEEFLSLSILRILAPAIGSMEICTRAGHGSEYICQTDGSS